MYTLHMKRCSFCAKTMDQVDHLIAGPAVFICNECVTLCSSAIEEREDEESRLTGEAAVHDRNPAPEGDRAVLHNLLREKIRDAFEARGL